MAFELLMGRLPFDEPPVIMALAGVRFIAPDRRTLRSDLDPEVAELVLACLSDAPDQRPTAAAAEETLLRATSQRPGKTPE
jgi:hypothetical protein